MACVRNNPCSPAAQAEIAQLQEAIDDFGITFTRTRPPIGGQIEKVDTYKGLWNAIELRPNYPGHVFSLGGENMDNSDRCSLLLAADADVDETDEVVLSADPRHVWIVEKGDQPLLYQDTLVGWVVWVARLRKNG